MGNLNLIQTNQEAQDYLNEGGRNGRARGGNRGSVRQSQPQAVDSADDSDCNR